MSSCYVMLAVYYGIPAIAFGAFYWWKTELVIGNSSAYWQERFDIRFISMSIVAAALWPIAGGRLAWSIYLRWPRGEQLLRELTVAEGKIESLESEIKKLQSQLNKGE